MDCGQQLNKGHLSVTAPCSTLMDPRPLPFLSLRLAARASDGALRFSRVDGTPGIAIGISAPRVLIRAPVRRHRVPASCPKWVSDTQSLQCVLHQSESWPIAGCNCRFGQHVLKTNQPSGCIKPGPLTHAERESMEQHQLSVSGYVNLLCAFRQVLPVIRHHHEKMDGSGHP